MNQSTRAITLVLISAGSVLAAHHGFDTLRQGYNDLDAEGDQWVSGSPTTQRGSGAWYGGRYHHYHYYVSSGGGGGWYSGSSSGGSSGSSSAHGSSFGGFGGTAHGASS